MKLRRNSIAGIVAFIGLLSCSLASFGQTVLTTTTNPLTGGGATAANQSQAIVGNTAIVTTGPGLWTSLLVPATATQATVTKAAGAAGVRHVCKSITATLACGATAQTPIQIYLRDGATGAGTILWAATVAAPVNGLGSVTISHLDIVGSPATAMTLEFSGAGVTASQEVVTLGGYDAN